MSTADSYTQQPANPPQKAGCLTWIILIIAWAWIIIVIAGRIASQLLASSALTMIPDAYWALFPGIEAVLLLIPLLPLAWLWRSEPWRSTYRAWLSASLYALLLTPISLVFPAASYLQSLLTILLSLLFIAVLITISRQRVNASSDTGVIARRDKSGKSRTSAVLIAMLVVAVFGAPWAAVGAFGSLLDILFGILVGITFGLAMASVLRNIFLPGLAQSGYSHTFRIIFGGFAAGVTIFIFASGVGYPFGAMQLLLAICLPPLGWLAISLSGMVDANTRSLDKHSSNEAISFIPVLLLLGIAAAFPLTLIDPDELAIVISASVGEILSWALIAAGISALVGWVVAAIIWVRALLRRPQLTLQTRSSLVIWRAAAISAWVVLLGIYLFVGHPGLYGEELFVVMQEQADMSSAEEISDPSARRQYVYDTLIAHSNRTQTTLRQDLDRIGIQYKPYYLVNGLQVRGGPLLRLWLQSRPEVDRILDSPQMRPLPVPLPIATGSQPAPEQPQWNLTQIAADRVWQELDITGEGVIIGQSDSGVQADHPDLADSYRGRDGDHNYNWYDPWNGTTQPTDILGHGTHTLGSVLGNRTGVAPGAQWIACANLARNLGNPANYLDCMQFMLAPFPLAGDPFVDGDPARGAQVLNNSWGCPDIEGCDTQAFLPAVRALEVAGIFVVASAGNDGPFCSTLREPIAVYNEVFTVGASDQSGGLAIFSSRGPVDAGVGTGVKPDIIAPGDLVLSTMPGSSYGTLSGTSMAGPHVAGTVALMWSANPNLVGDIQSTRDILASTAQPYLGLLPDCSGAADTPSTAVGYGLVNAYAAVQAALGSP